MAKWSSSSPSPKVSIREVFNFAIVKSVLSNKCSVHLRTLKMDFGKYFFSKKMSSSSISFNTRNSDVSLSTITFSQSFHGGKLPLQDFSFAWKITFTKSSKRRKILQKQNITLFKTKTSFGKVPSSTSFSARVSSLSSSSQFCQIRHSLELVGVLTLCGSLCTMSCSCHKLNATMSSIISLDGSRMINDFLSTDCKNFYGSRAFRTSTWIRWV